MSEKAETSMSGESRCLPLASGRYRYVGRRWLPQPAPSSPNPLPRPPIPGPLPPPDPFPPGPGVEEAAEGGAAFGPASIEPPPPVPAMLREALCLDVDGRYPQMTASGTMQGHLRGRLHWIASVKPLGRDRYAGRIWYIDGETSRFPYRYVDIRVQRSFFEHQRRATATFLAYGIEDALQHTYRYESPYFHPVEFEYDAVTGEAPVTRIQTHAHPNHPPTLPAETLSIADVYQRAGFDVQQSGGGSVVPLANAGFNAQWSNMEMHDAMQAYWLHFANRPQWAMWTLFAALHEKGSRLGGIMFDSIGPNQRQGTAVFLDSFIGRPPPGDPAPTAWVRRMRFWTAVHEMGHTFNLAHSWQKALGTPWIPSPNEKEARSFMNYPYKVHGGMPAFFRDFAYRFSDSELLFLRHAPKRFVQQGNADWFDHHGFEQAYVLPAPAFRLEVRTNRSKAAFEFMEPVVLEFKLTNISGRPQIMDRQVLTDLDDLTIALKKDGRAARQFAPYVHCFREEQASVLEPGASIYEPVFLGAGTNGWDLAEPGSYTVQAALHLHNEDIVSRPLRLRIAPPKTWTEAHLAQDFFSDEVGRILTFGGSRFLEHGNDALREVAAKMKQSAVALHARLALGRPLARPYKMLAMGKNGPASGASVQAANGAVEEFPAREEEAREHLRAALLEKPRAAAETLGHINYKRQADDLSARLTEYGAPEEAAQAQKTLHDTLKARGSLERVLKAIKRAQRRYEKKG